MKNEARSKALANDKKPIAYGVGYKNPRHTKDGGMKGTRYEYPIRDRKHLDIIKKSGGETRKA